MEREELYRDVIGHVEHEDLGHVSDAYKRAESRGPGKSEQDSA